MKFRGYSVNTQDQYAAHMSRDITLIILTHLPIAGGVGVRLKVVAKH